MKGGNFMACPFLKRSFPNAGYVKDLACSSNANPNCNQYGCGVDTARCDNGKDAAGNTYADCPFYKNGIK